MLLGIFAETLSEDHQQLAKELSEETRADLLLLSPQLTEVAPELKVDTPADPARLTHSFLVFLEALARYLGGRNDPVPLILLLDDLHWADRASLRLVASLAPAIASSPIWILGTAVSSDPALDHWLASIEDGCVEPFGGGEAASGRVVR